MTTIDFCGSRLDAFTIERVIRRWLDEREQTYGKFVLVGDAEKLRLASSLFGGGIPFVAVTHVGVIQFVESSSPLTYLSLYADINQTNIGEFLNFSLNPSDYPEYR